MLNILILLMGVACNAAASVLIKIATRAPYPPLKVTEPLAWLQNLPLWGGLACFGLAFGFYVLALQRLPLHVAHPVMTCGAVALVAVMAFLVFKEPMGLAAWAGILCILLGVLLLQLSLHS
jgi:multidrug transporter EmrE-like cation transporter